jgi:hypothetical protein
MRGRLINPFLAELYRLDTAATAADPDGAGALTSGYDPEFRETRRVADGSWAGASARKEGTAIRVRCQVEVPIWGEMKALLSGIERSDRVLLVFHYRDLERASLVASATGEANIRVNARLGGIYRLDGTLEQAMPGGGLYAIAAQTTSYGLGRRRNLLVVTFEGRDQAVSG